MPNLPSTSADLRAPAVPALDTATVVTGTAADDTLHGGKGRDHIDGGAGTDTMVYGGGFERYVVTIDAASGEYRVALVDRPDEVDTLSGVERLRFDDLDLSIDDAVAASQPGGPRPELLATAGDDQLIGGDVEYLLWGGEGDDRLQGNGGDDHLYGGKGDDTAVFRGPRADYELVFDTRTFTYHVSDRQSHRDGHDELMGIERVQFADGVVELFGIGGARLAGGGEILAPWQAPEAPWEVTVMGTWNTVGVGGVVVGESVIAGAPWQPPAASGIGAGGAPMPDGDGPDDPGRAGAVDDAAARGDPAGALVDLVGVEHRPWLSPFTVDA